MFPIQTYLKNKSQRLNALRGLLKTPQTVHGAEVSSHRCHTTVHPPLATAAPSIPAGRWVPAKLRELRCRRSVPWSHLQQRQSRNTRLPSPAGHPEGERDVGPGGCGCQGLPHQGTPMCRRTSQRGDLQAGFIPIPLSRQFSGKVLICAP